VSEGSGRILVNQVGFTPDAGKWCVVEGPPRPDFCIQRLRDTVWTPVFSGTLREGGDELGPGWVGDFSALREEGIYQVRCGALPSRCFVIYRGAYDVPMRVLFGYFPWQRCGGSQTGWGNPCHLEDGRIAGTGERVDLVGGYHQSSDLRKWACFVNIGLIGLAQFGLRTAAHWDAGQVA
jgi:hypothetical protein